MKYKERELKKGIKLHTIETSKFKTNLIAVMITTKLEKETVTKNAIIPAILRRGTVNMPTQEEINKKLEEMYGASFDCGVDKTGDNQILKFYLESVNDEFLPKENENMLKTSIEKILEIIFNPYIENEAFKKEYIEQEKENFLKDGAQWVSILMLETFRCLVLFCAGRQKKKKRKKERKNE